MKLLIILPDRALELSRWGEGCCRTGAFRCFPIHLRELELQTPLKLRITTKSQLFSQSHFVIAFEVMTYRHALESTSSNVLNDKPKGFVLETLACWIG